MEGSSHKKKPRPKTGPVSRLWAGFERIAGRRKVHKTPYMLVATNMDNFRRKALPVKRVHIWTKWLTALGTLGNRRLGNLPPHARAPGGETLIFASDHPGF
jgi:hypothetical protein